MDAVRINPTSHGLRVIDWSEAENFFHEINDVNEARQYQTGWQDPIAP